LRDGPRIVIFPRGLLMIEDFDDDLTASAVLAAWMGSHG
jgi:hypothetical protein